MNSGLHSILLRTGESIEFAIQSQSSFVDELPGCCKDIAEILVDYLSTECRVNLPQPNPSDDLPALKAITSLTKHDAKVLRTRILKRNCETLAEILQMYGRTGRGEGEWVDYFCRQHEHFGLETDRIAIVASIPGFTEAFSNPSN